MPEKRSNAVREEFFSFFEDLQKVLEEETRALTAIDREAMMRLLPRKLFLLERLEHLSRHEEVGEVMRSPEGQVLRNRLLTIKSRNERNRIFVEEALAVWNDFLSLLMPKQYRADGRAATMMVPHQGLTLRMEA